MERLVYSPEIFAYIYTASGQFIDISNDIISGSLDRNVNEISRVSLQIQNRYNSNGKPIYMGRIMPMDRIVIYLKKTKPILVFSGYLDLVPYYQPMPKPITIEASCTLKRLEFTYWDPGIETVYSKLYELGFIYDPKNGSGFLPDNTVAGSKRSTAEGEIQDTGFGALLRFLLVDVGQWNEKSIYISPLPKEWVTRAAGIYQQTLDDSKQLQEYLTNFLESMFNTNGGGAAGDSGGGGGTQSPFNGDMVQHLTSYLRSKGCPWPGEWAIAADSAGQKYNLDPRLLIAINGAEHSFGIAYKDAVERKKNPFGMGGPITSTGFTYSSWTEGFNAAAKNIADNYVKEGKRSIAAIGAKWAPVGASNDPNNLNANWPKNVKKFFEEVGGNPEASDGFPYPYTSSVSAAVEDVSNSLNVLTGGTGSENGTMIVEIQAGHTEPRQRGYKSQTGYPGEITFNLQNQAKIKSFLLSGEYKNEISSYNSLTGSSPERDYDGDIYIILHGDKQAYPGRRGGISYPGPWSKNAQGISAPNSYASSGEEVPERAVRSVATDSGLSSNSKRLATYINKHVSALTNNTLDPDLSNGRMCNNYAFYYNKAKASVIIEMPQIMDPKLHEAIAQGILDYKRNASVAAVSNPAATNIDAPAPASGPSATAEENSNAKKLMQVLTDYATNHPETGYSMTARQGGKALSDVDPNGSMDCSSFVANGMIEIGVESEGYNATTVTFGSESQLKIPLGQASPEKLVPGMFVMKPYAGGAGHVMVYIGNNKVVHCSSEADGPVISDYTAAKAGYGGYIHPKIGTTSQVVTGAEVLSDNSPTAGDVSSIAKRAAFNVFFNFPVNQVESLMLTGYRSFENDVKLLETIEEITKASMRVFASLPDGGFIAWYPDYFNISGRTPWYVISPNEIIDCTIDLSDKYLATHVYLTGNPLGIGFDGSSTPGNQQLDRFFGTGVATIEQPYILDSFLRPPITVKDKRKRPESIIETQGAVYKFLSKYGVRPYNEKQMTLRHPAIEFFYAYHKFMELWAKQFVSRIELTFQPEIFPGMIVEIQEKDGPGFACYVDQVSHTFSYTGGFTTQLSVMALSSLAKVTSQQTGSIHPSLALITRSAAPLKIVPIKKPNTVKKKTTTTTQNKKISSRGVNTTGGTPRLNKIESPHSG